MTALDFGTYVVFTGPGAFLTALDWLTHFDGIGIGTKSPIFLV
jgi:hypothetical protein